jgi:hypothetical protein
MERRHLAIPKGEHVNARYVELAEGGDTRLSRMLHVLVHMHLLGGTETSDTIARMLNTKPGRGASHHGRAA